jgi:hypothetical protein
MGEACSRMDLTAIHQILVMTHYKDDEGTNEVIALEKEVLSISVLEYADMFSKTWLASVIFPRVDATDERYVGIEKARGLCIPRQRF